jgi:hypothetical protein
MPNIDNFPNQPEPKRQELRDAINSLRGEQMNLLVDIEMLLNVAIDIAVKEALENKVDITSEGAPIKINIPEEK